jgi:hypothetical protein
VKPRTRPLEVSDFREDGGETGSPSPQTILPDGRSSLIRRTRMSRTPATGHSQMKADFFFETRLAGRLLHRSGICCAANYMPVIKLKHFEKC